MHGASKSYSQEALLSSIKKRDKDAIRILFDTYASVIYNIINKQINDTALCEQILQTVFVKILQNLSSFDASKQRFITWILVIARNETNTVIKNQAINSGSQIREVNNNVNLYNKDILSLICFKGYSLQMAAEAMNITFDEAKLKLKEEFDQIRAVNAK
ncbi:MAG: hypothetical protein JNJ40_07485 [Bacteroidia bacterium]|nr:hypothetical protein [Bacteroidia bacterium]